VIIAWDGRGLVGPRTGIGWYTHHLIRGFETLEVDWSADLYLNKAIDDKFDIHVTPRVYPFPNTVRLRTPWESLLLPLMLRHRPPDIWHSPLSVVPRGLPCKSVATIHDLGFLHYPEILPAAYRQYWTRRIEGACARADRLIAVSEATREDLRRWFDVPEERVTVVYEAADPFYTIPSSREESATVLSQLGVEGDYFLFVGTLEPRKNLSFLLDVYKLLIEKTKTPPPLLVAGGKGWLQEDVDSKMTAFGGRVRLLGYLHRRDLRALYRCAKLVLVPSKYEGFGLQAVEALASGAVVLASNVSSLPEVVGEGGILLPIDPPEVWVDKIIELADNEPELGRLHEKAVRQASRFSWLRAAQETIGVYQGVMGS
jgi:glycosyltransferase involved in cell wall biosynthesis